MHFKQEVYTQCAASLNEKIHFLQKTLKDLTYSASNETKSTAGDKHETALAMLQIEQENTNRQLRELLLQKLIIDKIDPTASSVAVTTGSLVKTDKDYFYLSIPLGKVMVAGIPVIALSIKSPLGQKLLDSKLNGLVEINNVTYRIEAIQ